MWLVVSSRGALKVSQTIRVLFGIVFKTFTTVAFYTSTYQHNKKESPDTFHFISVAANFRTCVCVCVFLRTCEFRFPIRQKRNSPCLALGTCDPQTTSGCFETRGLRKWEVGKFCSTCTKPSVCGPGALRRPRKKTEEKRRAGKNPPTGVEKKT